MDTPQQERTSRHHMEPPLLHIGLHKTATSWLQKHLFGRRDRGFFPLAPVHLSGEEAAKFCGDFFIRDRRGQLLSPFEERGDEVMEFLDSIPRVDGALPVISQERLAGNPHAGKFDARAIAERLYRCFPDSQIFCVIREQSSLLISTYFQYLRIGGFKRLEDYCTASYDHHLPGFALSSLQHHLLLEHYYRLWGENHCLTLPFELFQDEPDCFFDRLGSFLGRTINTPPEISVPEHQGLPRIPQYYSRHLNLFARRDSVNAESPLVVPGFGRILRLGRRCAGVLIPDNWEQRFVTSMKLTATKLIGSSCDESNRLCSELIGIDLREFGYPC